MSLADGGKIVDAVDHGDIDMAIVWGPVAGYFAKGAHKALVLQPVSPRAFQGVPFVFDISTATRKNDDPLGNEIHRVLSEDARAIRFLLDDYGVPQLH